MIQKITVKDLCSGNGEENISPLREMNTINLRTKNWTKSIILRMMRLGLNI